MKNTNILCYPIFGYIVIVVIFVHCISNGVSSRQYEYINVYNLNGIIHVAQGSFSDCRYILDFNHYTIL